MVIGDDVVLKCCDYFKRYYREKNFGKANGNDTLRVRRTRIKISTGRNYYFRAITAAGIEPEYL